MALSFRLMRLSELVKDPFPDFGEDEELDAAVADGRQAVREVLVELVQPANEQSVAPPVREVLQQHLNAGA